MSAPQSGILPDGNSHALFVTLDVAANAASSLRRGVGAIPALTEEIAAAAPEAALRSVLAIGPACWDGLFPDRRPAGLRPFGPFADGGRVAPSTHADILIHLRSERRDLNFELGRKAMAALGGGVSVVEEVAGFRYRDNRDLTGFVDGTENPQGEDRADVALVGADDPDFAGGSYVSVQRYIHDLPSWEEVPVADQERIIGRTKADNVEFESAAKAPTAHIKRVSVKRDGTSMEILRHSMPYGSVSEHGLYFIAYCDTPDNFKAMLERMIVADGDGNYDHLMRFSRAVTGASFFAPPVEFLRAHAP